jgi:hypothetical protein
VLYFHEIVNGSEEVATLGAVIEIPAGVRVKSEPSHVREKEVRCKSPHSTITIRTINATIATTLESKLEPPSECPEPLMMGYIYYIRLEPLLLHRFTALVKVPILTTPLF